MAVKYTIPFKDYGDQQWRVDITDAISGSGNPVFNFTIDDSVLPIVQTTLSINDLTNGQYIGGSGTVNLITASATGTSGVTSGTFNNAVAGTLTGHGSGAVFNVAVQAGAVTSLTQVAYGNDYAIGDTFEFGVLPGLTFTITSITSSAVTNGSVSVPQGDSYQIHAGIGNVPQGTNPRLRLTILENGILIFDRSVPAPNPVAQIIKTGMAVAGYIYDITVTGDYSPTQVTPIDNESDPSGIPIGVRGNGQAGVLAWQPDTTDDPFFCYASGTLTINCINEGQINVEEIRKAQDMDFMAKVYRSGSLYWQGYIVPDGVQNPHQSFPYNFTFTAICGLTMLADIPYIHTDLPGTTTAISKCPMNYIRDILFNLLGNTLPIRWSNLLQCTAFPGEDVFAGSVQWGADGQSFITYTGSTNDGDESIPQTCDYILQGILRSNQCCIYLDNGRWNIRRIPDRQRYALPYNQISGDTGVMNLQTGTDALFTQIGRYGYPFINENQIITTRKGIKSCQVTYQANVRNNILPNGSQDLQNQNIPFGPLYWDIWSATNPFTVSSVTSLDGRAGYASDLIFQGISGNPAEYFTMFTSAANPVGKRGLPLDTAVMVPYIIFGFQFEIVQGFPLVGSTQVIDWSSNPLQIKVIYNTGGTQYFLNPYGFWTLTDTSIPISVDNLSMGDVAQIDFNAFQNIPIPLPSGDIVAGFENNIQILFRVADGQFYKVDNIYLNIQGGNEVYESTNDTGRNTTIDQRTINISSSFSGYNLSNFMTSPFNSGDECYFADAAAYTGTLTGLTANAIMRCCYKASDIFNGDINVRGQLWNFDSMFNIDGSAGAPFMPLAASYNLEQAIVNNLIAIEMRNDNATFTEQYYNSNTVTTTN